MFNYQRTKIESKWLQYRYFLLLASILALAAFFSPNVLADNVEIVDYQTNCETCGKIGGIVWNDLNWNGRQDPNEGGIGGVMLRLWMLEDGKYKIYRAQTTGRAGIYIFDDLLAGSYRIEVVESRSPGLQHCVQTTHRSPTPVIELLEQQVLRYDFSYTAQAGYAQQVPITGASTITWPTTYNQLELPAVFLNVTDSGESASLGNQGSGGDNPDPGLPPLPEPTPPPNPGPQPPRPQPPRPRTPGIPSPPSPSDMPPLPTRP